MPAETLADAEALGPPFTTAQTRGWPDGTENSAWAYPPSEALPPTDRTNGPQPYPTRTLRILQANDEENLAAPVVLMSRSVHGPTRRYPRASPPDRLGFVQRELPLLWRYVVDGIVPASANEWTRLTDLLRSFSVPTAWKYASEPNGRPPNRVQLPT